MTQTGTSGDHITLRATSKLYNLELLFSLANNAQTPIQLQEFEPITTFYLDHFADSSGAYYIPLDQISSNVIKRHQF